MNYLRGWRALRQDPDWIRKTGIATVLVLSSMCVPIVGQVTLLGWCTLALRRAVSGQDSPLPELSFDFDYLGKLLGIGFKAFLARLLWSLPLVPVLMAFGCCIYFGAIAAAMGTFQGAQSGGDGPAFGRAFGALVMVVVLVCYPLIAIVGSLPVHVAMLRAELSDDVSSAVRPRDVLAMTKLLWKELLVGMLVMSLFGLIATLFGLVTLYLGLLPAMTVLTILQTYWRAELYGVYLEKGGPPLPVGPLEVSRPAPAPPFGR